MAALQITLHAFGAQFPFIKGELFPGLETDHMVVTDFQLNAALLAAKAAMRLDQLFCRIA